MSLVAATTTSVFPLPGLLSHTDLFQNVIEHNPPCKPNPGGHYEKRDPPKWAEAVNGGTAQVQREVGMDQCLECYEVFREEEQNAKAEKKGFE